MSLDWSAIASFLLVVGLVALMILLIYRLYRRVRDKNEIDAFKLLYSGLFVSAGTVILAYIWLVVGALMPGHWSTIWYIGWTALIGGGYTAVAIYRDLKWDAENKPEIDKKRRI